MAIQDWEQIQKLYLQHDAATLEGRLKIKVACALGISETRERVVAKYAGRRTIETWVKTNRDKPEKVRHETEIEIEVIEPDYLNNDLGVRKNGDLLVVRVVVFGLGNPAIAEIPSRNGRNAVKATAPLLGQRLLERRQPREHSLIPRRQQQPSLCMIMRCNEDTGLSLRKSILQNVNEVLPLPGCQSSNGVAASFWALLCYFRLAVEPTTAPLLLVKDRT